MSKYLKKIIVISLVCTIFTVNLFHPKAEEVTYENGYLRCPVDSKHLPNGKPSSCRESVDSDGMRKVEITTVTKEKIEITKIVKQTSTVGKYSVQFKIKGETTPQLGGDIYFVLDASHSIGEHYLNIRYPDKNVVNAIRNFADYFKNNYSSSIKNFRFGFVSFYNDSASNKTLLASKNFVKYNTFINYYQNVISSFGDNCKGGRVTLNDLKNAYKNGNRLIIDNGNNAYFSCGNYDKNDKSTTCTTTSGAKVTLKEGYCRSYVKQDIDNHYKFKVNMYNGSPIKDALNTAYNVLTKDENDNKFLVILTDGIYENTEYGCNSKDKSSSRYLINKIKKSGTDVYIVRFSSSDDRSSACESTTLGLLSELASAPLDSHISNVSDNNYSNAFEEIARKIGLQQPVVSATLTDQLGEDFTLDNGGTSITFSPKKISGDGAVSKEYFINIDQSADKGWHYTNQGYTIEYGNGKSYAFKADPEVYWNSKNKIESCSDTVTFSNYIVENNYTETDKKASYYKLVCSEVVNVNQVINNQVEGSKSFNIKNGLGFTFSSKYNTNMTCKYEFDLNTYNKDLNQFRQNINDYYSKTTELYNSYTESANKIKDTNIPIVSYHNKKISNYNWNTTWTDAEKNSLNEGLKKYEKMVNDLKNTINNEKKDESKIASLNKELQNVSDIIIKFKAYVSSIDNVNINIEYIKKLETVLSDYRDNILPKFPENTIGSYYQQIIDNAPTLSIVYDKNNDKKILNVNSNNYFQNNEVSPLEYSCSNYSTGDLNKKCNITFSKSITFKEKCVDLSNGKVVDCAIGSKKQLLGGMKYYLDENSTGAHIGVNYIDLGLDKKTQITMDGSEESGVCYAHVVNTNLLYRQIDINDPFIQEQQYNSVGKRKIGINYLNNKYNFVKLAGSSVWSNTSNYNGNNTADYVYQLSKQNIVDIKKNTLSLNTSSYLGNNCYVNSVNKYICPFTRNISDSSNINYFSFFQIKQ